MNNDPLVRQVRAEDPAADVDRNPRSATGRRLLAQARRRGAQATALPPRPARRRVVITAIAGLVALSGAGALASGVFDPEPEDVTTVLDDAQEHLTPHSLRHSAITAALNAGVALRDVQEFARHADPGTTIRYDRARHSLDRHVSYTVMQYVSGAS